MSRSTEERLITLAIVQNCPKIAMSPASVLPLCGVYSMDFLSILSG